MSSLRTRRLTAAAAASIIGLGAAVVAMAPPAGAVPGFDFNRLQGADRYATAAAIARASFPTATTALLANGQRDDPRTSRDEDHFPDALAGNYLAGARNAPVLLTTETVLPSATTDALEDLGVTTVVILGGPDAVSASQQQQLRDEGYTVSRIGGTDRYATAAAVARAPGQAYVGSVDGARTAVVASGMDFPDALVTGPLSYAGKLPLTITDPQKLSPATRSVLTDLDIDQVLIPGGNAAVSAGVEQEIEDLGIAVRRFAGTGRTETAAMVANYAIAQLGFSDEHVNLARGDDYADALAGGPHAGKEQAPVLLTARVDALGTATRGWLRDHCSTLRAGHIFGGVRAVTAAVEDDAETAARSCGGASPSPSSSVSPTASPSSTASPSPTSSPGTIQSCGTNPNTTSPSPTASATPSDTSTATTSPSPSPSASASASPTENPNVGGGRTTRPELVSVAYAGAPTLNDAGTATDTRDDYCTVQVRYTFDEPVIGKQPVASRFLLIGFDPSVRYTGTTALVESGGTGVLVTFGRANNPTTAADERVSVGGTQTVQVSLAAVDADAVADNSARGNPIGELPLGRSDKPFLYSPGITAAPDLVSVDLASSGATTAALRFEFDETVARIVKASGFHVVTQDARDVPCSNPVIAGTTVTVTCPVAAADVLSRGYVESGTVSDAASEGNLNPLHAEPVESAAGTDVPDLVSAQFQPGPTGDAAANSDDKVLYTFSESVFIGDQTGFVVYQADGTEVRSTGAQRQSDPTRVLATFPDEVSGLPLMETRTPALETAVGASVLEAAVTEAGGTNRPNQPDEVGVQNPTTTDTTAGRTSGPDLVSVTVDTSGLRPTATFTFDEVLSEDPSTVAAAKLVLYTADGTAVPCRTAVPMGDENVLCTSFGNGTGTPVGAVIGTADDSAVQDGDGEGNPEGVAPVTTVT